MQTLNAQHATMNGAPDPQPSARAPPLVGPYPIDEDALRRLKRLGWNQLFGGTLTLLDILRQQPRTTTNLRFTQYFREKLLHAGGFRFPSAARFPPPGTSAVDSCRPM